MDESTRNTLRAAEEAVHCLVEECRKNGSLYALNPKAVAQVSRTGKWHINAIAALCKSLHMPSEEDGK